MTAPSLKSLAFAGRLVRVWRDTDGKPWFVAEDVADALEIRQIHPFLMELDEDERSSCTADGPDGPQELHTLSESGAYALLLGSRTPQARQFRRWLCREGLPALVVVKVLPGRRRPVRLPRRFPRKPCSCGPTCARSSGRTPCRRHGLTERARIPRWHGSGRCAA